ncbi:MAG: hypothetical protein P8M19_01180 [Crocinitomicaceae bacterium]|nr:hypothetical protein [Crocinitomicaceae bacterium]MDG2440256.1 hypothetical protein [Crocinitomicaceae bacterium]|tara:strand:- start:2439 stop:2699 length:261 start_codon:yes stop_codon:yes gene_type:complete
MVYEASIVGAFRMIAIFIGVFVLVRFLGQLMNAKRNRADQEEDRINRQNLKNAREHTKKNLGKTRVLRKKDRASDIEDIDFEEVED